ncbi:MAG TPA: hypothetical protein ENH24_01075, partial [Nitrospirae bacterium]|nr:hypothetical protein [Nitrospirota bacterium]
MANKKSKTRRLASIIGIIIASFGILFFLLRGPYLSNSIKRILLPVLENATRERIIIDKAVINLLPFYVQTKGFKLFDKDGNRLLWITKTRVYIDLLALLSKEFRIRKLTLKEPRLTVREEDLRRIIENIKKSSSVGKKGKYSISLKNIKLTDGELDYSNAEKGNTVSVRGLFLDMVSKNTASVINMRIKDGTLIFPNESELSGGLDARVRVENQLIKVSEINIHSSKSSFKAKGEVLISDEGKITDGRFTAKTKIYASTINKFFALKQEKDALLSFEGSIGLVPEKDSTWPAFALDLKTDSRFYLETLMEILKVKANITGKVSVNGTIRGTFPDITGKGKAKLENAVFDNLPIDEADGEVTYKDNKFALNGFKAHAYNGQLEGDAHILIPGEDFMVDADISGIDSRRLFKFIKWEPPFPDGKIEGDVYLSHGSGRGIEVTADVAYRNTSQRQGDLPDRIESFYTGIKLKNNILRLKDTVVSTSLSDLFLNGIIDLHNKTLDLDLRLKSPDVTDLTAPYYTKLAAPVRFEGRATGAANDPEIKGKLVLDSGSVNGIGFTEASAALTYRIRSLSVDRLVIRQDNASYGVSGTIDFKKAAELFSFDAPFYTAEAELTNVGISPFIKVFYKDIPVSGRVSGKVSFEGDSADFVSSGDLSVSGTGIYGQGIDRIALKYRLRPEEIEFKSLKVYRGESDLEAKGTLFFNKNFNISASSNRIKLSDFPVFSDYPFDLIFGMDMDGSGSIDNPDLKFSINIDESFFRGVQMGKGEIKGTFNNKKLRAEGSFINGLVTAEAGALFSDRISWNVNSKFKKGRYDFLLSGFMKEVPADFRVFLEGGVRMEGVGDKISVISKFNSATLSLYGYDFRNSEDIDLELVDNELRIKSFSLTGNNADMSAAGTLKINDEYNLTVNGNLDIAPLRAFSDKLSSLRGRSSFAIDVTGAWKSPEISGEINIDNANAALTGFPYKIGPINGSFLLQKDRITVKSISSRFAGGTVVMSGAAYFKLLSLDRFFMSADISGIRIRPFEGLNAALDGRLFFETSSKGSSLTGNIDIKKARYEKRVEWKSWLLGLKEIRKERAEYPAFLADTALNIHIEGLNDIIIDNNIARTPVKITLNVTGTVAQKGLLGRIEASEGTVYFRNNEFKILEGSSVDFVEPDTITPVFHILADTYISDYYVRLSLDGTMDEFTLSLFSDPPLPEPDILALLTVGQLEKEQRGIESGIAAAEATAILTGGLQDTVEEQFKDITGFERFEIEPHIT